MKEQSSKTMKALMVFAVFVSSALTALYKLIRKENKDVGNRVHNKEGRGNATR